MTQRIDTSEIRQCIVKRLGRGKSGKYFYLVNKYLSCRISKPLFDKLCVRIIGKDNVGWHNKLMLSVLKNASLSKTPLGKDGKGDSALGLKVKNGCHAGSLQFLCGNVFPKLTRKGRAPAHGPSPLGKKPHTVEDVPKAQKQKSPTELHSLGSRPPPDVSMEDGEEIEQNGNRFRASIVPPLGVYFNNEATRASSSSGPSCYDEGVLPDTMSLMNRLQKNLEEQGLTVSKDCVNLLNNSLDVYLKRLIKPCLELTASRARMQHTVSRSSLSPRALNSISMTDFRTAMELNPRLLGVNWSSQLERISFQ